MIWTWDIFSYFDIWLENLGLFNIPEVSDHIEGLQLIYIELLRVHYIIYVIMIIVLVVAISKLMKFLIYFIKDLIY